MSDLRKSIVGILSKNDRPKYAGTGFFVAGGLIVTCAHVLDKARTLKGHFLYTMNERDGWLHAERVYLSETNELDIAVLRPLDLPSHPPPLRLISSRNNDLHPFKSFGYPSEGDGMGMHGDGHINNWRRDSLGRSALQISSDTVTHGFSGCPVWDNDLGGVVGMVSSGFNFGLDKKLGKVAFAIPSEILNQAYPDLPVEEVVDENARLLVNYRARLMDETRFVNLSGIPLPQGQRLAVPLDHVYIRLQAIEEKQRRERDEAERRVVQDRAERDRTEQDGSKDVLATLRALGEFFYRRGEVIEAEKRPEPVNPQQVLEKYKRLVVLGSPGAGKSTLLRYLARRAAERPDGPLPIPVLLRDFATARAQDNSLSLREFALRQAAAGDRNLHRALNAEVVAGRVLWLVDALDEARVYADDAAKQAGQLPGQLLLTSRPVDYKGVGLEGLPHFEVLPLQPADVQQFLQNWFALLGGAHVAESDWIARAGWLKDQLAARPRLKPLTLNPLLLTFLAVLAGNDSQRDLPAQRAELYSRYVNELLDSWEAVRRLEHKSVQGGSALDPAKLADKRMRKMALDCFYYLGWRLHLAYYGGNQQNAPTKELLAQALALYLRPEWGDDAPDKASAALNFWIEAGMIESWLLKGTHYLAFRHLTFQEYAAAWGLAQVWRRNPQRAWDFLKPRLHHYAWREPILLLVGLLEQKQLDDLTTRLLRGQSPYEKDLHRDLLLAGELLAEGAELAREREILERLMRFCRQGRWITKTVCALFARIGVRAVPILLKTFLKSLRGFDFNVHLHENAAVALGQIGDLQAVPALLEALRSGSGVRKSAAKALGQIGDIQAVPALLEALHDDDPDVCKHAAEALGRIGDLQAVPYLLEALRGGSLGVRKTAAEALGLIGDAQAVPALLEALRDDTDWNVRSGVAKALNQIDSPLTMPFLLGTFRHSPWHIRKDMPEALGLIGGEQAVIALLEALRYGPDWMRRDVVLALGNIGNPQVIPALLEALQNGDSNVREATTRALAKFSDADVILALQEALHDNEKDVRRCAVDALKKINTTQAVPALLKALYDDDWGVRERAVEALVQIGGRQVGTALLETLNDDNEYVFVQVISALGKIANVQAVPALLQILCDNDKGGRAHSNAATALGRIGDTQAIPALLQALLSKDSGVRGNAALALGQIGNVGVVPSLMKTLCDNDWIVRVHAAEALGQIGNSQAVPVLLQALYDDSGNVNRKAAEALGQIGDPLAVPALLRVLRNKAWWVGIDNSVVTAVDQIIARVLALQVQALPLDDPLLPPEKSSYLATLFKSWR